MEEEIEKLKRDIKILERRLAATINITSKAIAKLEGSSSDVLIASIYEAADKDQK